MKRTLFLVLMLFVVGCGYEITIDLGNGWTSNTRPSIEYPQYEVEVPTVNLETALRQRNWAKTPMNGSCVYATLVSLFRWQGRDDLATRIREKYDGGTGWFRLAAELDAEGIEYAFTNQKNDVAFLEWACKTRRGAGVTTTGGSHMIALVYLDDKRAGFIDNNKPEEILWKTREEFLTDWFSATSWAITPLMGPPPPPLPTKDKKQ